MSHARGAGACVAVCLLLSSAPAARGGEALSLYGSLRRFELGGGSAVAENLSFKRDRAEMVFSGKFYFEQPIAGRVRGAVFLGNGTFRAETPGSFERDNLRRLIEADRLESDFHSAVLRFSDGTFEELGLKPQAGAAPPEA